MIIRIYLLFTILLTSPAFASKIFVYDSFVPDPFSSQLDSHKITINLSYSPYPECYKNSEKAENKCKFESIFSASQDAYELLSYCKKNNLYTCFSVETGLSFAVPKEIPLKSSDWKWNGEKFYTENKLVTVSFMGEKLDVFRIFSKQKMEGFNEVVYVFLFSPRKGLVAIIQREKLPDGNYYESSHFVTTECGFGAPEECFATAGVRAD